jgi:non-ribosomal peptide synthetase component F
MVIGKALSKRALITPDREALIFNNKTFTYQELNHGQTMRQMYLSVWA